MIIWIKNTTDSDKIWSGQVVHAGEYYDIKEIEVVKWSENVVVLTDIVSGDAVIATDNTGNGDIANINDAINYLKGTKIHTNSQQYPFSNKTLPDGKKLYKRCTGIDGVEINNGETKNLDYVVAYPHMKIVGACIFNTNFGDIVNFYIYDDANGTYSGTPNYLLNQFGFNINMPEGSMENTCKYDADLYYGMKVRIEYTNNSGSTKTVYANFDLHEVEY
jgi:hypothetical protein